jgi:hypothetical protein
MSPKRLTSTLVRTEAILLAHLAAAPSRAVDKVSNFAAAPMLREEKLKQGFSFGPPAFAYFLLAEFAEELGSVDYGRRLAGY